MNTTPENIDLCLTKLALFQEYKGFPRNDGMLERHAKALCRAVHNKPVGEIMAAACKKNGVKFDLATWEKKHNLAGDANDLEWLIDSVILDATEYPLPIVLREAYDRILPLAEEFPQAQAAG
jgi:hypothetical protein